MTTNGDTLTITVSSGRSFVVNANKWESLCVLYRNDGSVAMACPSSLTWNICDRGYVNAKFEGRGVAMHRLITECNRFLYVNHIDFNCSNNATHNLEIVNMIQNSQWRKHYMPHWLSIGITRASQITLDMLFEHGISVRGMTLQDVRKRYRRSREWRLLKYAKEFNELSLSLSQQP